MGILLQARAQRGLVNKPPEGDPSWGGNWRCWDGGDFSASWSNTSDKWRFPLSDQDNHVVTAASGLRLEGDFTMKNPSNNIDSQDSTWIFRKNKVSDAKPIGNPFHKDLDKVAPSFYVSNFPDSIDSKGLWNVCTPYGRLVDVFIANKRSKRGALEKQDSEFDRYISLGRTTLIDLPMGGHAFTWMNKAGTKLSKFDRFLITKDILESLADIRVTALDCSWSNHNPILLHYNKFDFRPIPFKLYYSWFLRDGFDEVVMNELAYLGQSGDGTKLSSLVKLKLLKAKIKEWYVHSKNNERAHKQDVLDYLEAQDLIQKARIKWDSEGDENTKFFHGLVNQKQRSNSIHGVMYEGSWVSEPHQVKEAFLNFFKAGSNSSFITLIPKVSNPIHIKDFRLISLIGIHYKIIAKILANRLSKVIDKIISHEQSAFITGFQILDGPLMLSEMIDWYKTRKKKMLIFKVYFEKAFDSVSWRYLDFVLYSHGFGVKWRSWIRECLVSSRTSILVNGSPTSVFSIKRGLRQGDPLSPFLFILFMEGLHVALSDAVHSGLIHGVKFGSLAITLSHLFYADEIVITTEWSTHDMDNIIRVLQVFYLASGLKINIHKSNVYGIGVSVEEVSLMANNTGCTSGSFPFVYLGLPIGANMNNTSNWKLLLDRFLSRLSSWKANLLSIGGRLTLIKAVLGSLGIYYLSIFKAPKFVLKAMERIRAIFFWGDPKIKKNLLRKMTPVWSIAHDGVFSVGVTRRHIDAHLLPSLDHPTTWDKSLPRKVNIFMWRLLLDRLSHRLNLSSRGIEITEISCPSCNGNVESNLHIFFECDIAKDIWRQIRTWCEASMPSFDSHVHWRDWLSYWHDIHTTSLWWKWRFRNNVTFNSHSMRKSDIFDNIRLYFFSWLKSRGRMFYSWTDWLKSPM
ncbi:putative RNA-directed DNA polymerase, eukaryota, reverse transcriptase zinc-binding domain protein [Tanacetum coccineum]